MDNLLKIFTEQLRDGKREEIERVLSPDFLNVAEQELVFKNPVHLKGEAYTVDDLLILQLSAQTEVSLPCSICNEMTFVLLQAHEICHTIPLDDLKSTIFDFSDLVREEIVLLIPPFVECREGQCPERAVISKFMKNRVVSPPDHFPFADL